MIFNSFSLRRRNGLGDFLHPLSSSSPAQLSSKSKAAKKQAAMIL